MHALTQSSAVLLKCYQCVHAMTGLTVLKVGLRELGLLDADISAELDQVRSLPMETDMARHW